MTAKNESEEEYKIRGLADDHPAQRDFNIFMSSSKDNHIHEWEIKELGCTVEGCNAISLLLEDKNAYNLKQFTRKLEEIKILFEIEKILVKEGQLLTDNTLINKTFKLETEKLREENQKLREEIEKFDKDKANIIKQWMEEHCDKI